MAVTADKVVVELEAEYQKFVADTATAAKRFEDSLAGMVQSGKTTEAQIKQAFKGIGESPDVANDGEKLGATFGSRFGISFLRTVLSSVFGGALFAAILKDAEAMGDLENAARRATIPLNKMQEIIFVLSREGLNESQTVRDIQNLTKLLADASSDPRNSLRRLFEVNGITIGGKDAQAVILDLARLMQDAPEGIKTRIIELSGLSEKWISVLEKGPDAFLENQKAANAAGAVLDELAFRKAEAFRTAWNDATTAWGTVLRDEITKILPLLDTVVDKGIKFLSTVAQVAGTIATELQNFTKAGSDFSFYTDEQLKLLKEFHSTPGPFYNKDALQKIEQVITVRNSTSDFGYAEPTNTKLRQSTGNDTTKLPPRRPEREDKDPAEDALRKKIALLKAEAETIGETYFERDALRAQTELLTAAYNAGLKPSEELSAHTRKLGEEYAAAAEKVRLAKDQWEAANALAREFGNSAIDGIQGLISGTKTLNQVLADTLKTLSTMALKAALLGEGPLATFFGTKSDSGGVGGLLGPVAKGIFGLFGGARADGGPVQAGKSYLVGERGMELFTPNVNGMITPNGGGQPNGGNNYAIYADMRDSSAQAIAVLSQRIETLRAELPDLVGSISSEHRRLAPYG